MTLALWALTGIGVLFVIGMPLLIWRARTNRDRPIPLIDRFAPGTEWQIYPYSPPRPRDVLTEAHDEGGAGRIP